jgi:hypothetical protein
VGDTASVDTGEEHRDPLTLSLKDWNEEFDLFAGQTRALAATLPANEREHVIGRLNHLVSQLQNAGSSAPKQGRRGPDKVGKPKASKKAA